MSADRPAERVSLDVLLAHRDWVRALARSLVLDQNEADDLEQETWRRAIEHPPRHAESPRSWLATVVRNAARMSRRGSWRRSRHEAAVRPRSDVPSPEDLVVATELQARLVRVVLELDEPYRSAVLYRFHEGLEPREIAARLGVPLETVRTRLKRGVERLRERMDVDLGDDRDAWCLLVVGVRADPALPLAPIAVGAAASAVVGGFVMAGTKALLVTAAVVVAGAAWWLWPKGGEPAQRVETASATAPASEPEKSVPQRREPRTRTHPSDEPRASVAAPPAAVPLDREIIHGRVIDDETGAPVPNVVVTLVSEPPTTTQEEPPPPSMTAQDGTFRIRCVSYSAFPALRVRADGYADSLSSSSAVKPESIDVRIYRGKRVSGRVLAADGRTPVAGASIRLSDIPPMWGHWSLRNSVVRGVTTDDGTFSIERVAPAAGNNSTSLHSGPYAVFAVSAEGLGWTKLPGDAGKVDATGIEFTLRPIGTASVTVRDAAGSPRAGVDVVAAPRFEPLGHPPERRTQHDAAVPPDPDLRTLFAATTDAEGIARFTALPTGAEGSPYDFIVRDGAAKAWKDGVAVSAGEGVSVDIVFGKARKWSIAGVVRRADGTPIEHALVSGAFDSWETTTGGDGSFRIEPSDPTSESYSFMVFVEGRGEPVREVKRDAEREVVDVEVFVQPMMPVEGRVVDQDGKPIAGVMVCLSSDADANLVLPDQTGVDGRFAFSNASAGTWNLRTIPPEPRDEWEVSWLMGRMPVVHGGDRDVVAVLRRVPPGKARVVVTVVDDLGAPLAPDEAYLAAAPDDRGMVQLPYGTRELANGRVELDRVKPGRWQLWLSVPGRIGTVVAVDVAVDQTEVPLRVVVGRPGRLRGRVALGNTGAAMPGTVTPASPLNGFGQLAPWALPHGPGMKGSARVEQDGTFEFPEVMPGRWRVSVEGEGVVGEAFADVPAGGEGSTVIWLTRRADAPAPPK